MICDYAGLSYAGWAKGAVMYQIFVDRFCNGDPSNDVLDDEYVYIGQPVCRVKDWNQVPSPMGRGPFLRRGSEGVWDKLDYCSVWELRGFILTPFSFPPPTISTTARIMSISTPTSGFW